MSKIFFEFDCSHSKSDYFENKNDAMQIFINNLQIHDINEKKFSTMEKERPNEMEVATEKDEEREEKESESLSNYISYW